MLRIRGIYDIVPINKLVMAQVQAMLHTHFSLLSEARIVKLPEKSENPLKHGFWMIFGADDRAGQVKDLAPVLHEPDLKFCFPDKYLFLIFWSLGVESFEKPRIDSVKLNFLSRND